MPCCWCRKRKLESLVGHLHHAAKVVWLGRAFLRRLIDLLCCFRNKDHPIWINQDFRLDLQWWQKFLSSWHGIRFWLFPGMQPATDLRLVWMQRAHLALVPIFRASGFMVVIGAGKAIDRIPRALPSRDCCSLLGILVGPEGCPVSFR